MTLDKKRKQLELSRVEVARQELEFKIEERLDEIKRLEAHIEVQKTKEAELKEELAKLN